MPKEEEQQTVDFEVGAETVAEEVAAPEVLNVEPSVEAVEENEVPAVEEVAVVEEAPVVDVAPVSAEAPVEQETPVAVEEPAPVPAPAAAPAPRLAPEAPVAEEAQNDESDEVYVPVNTQKGLTGTAVRRPAAKPKASQPLPAGSFFAINFNGVSGNGAIGIANALSTSAGGSATSHATAYAAGASHSRFRANRYH